MTWIVNLWWRLVFWWKRRTGWIHLADYIVVEGVVVEKSDPDIDGDRCFNLRLHLGDRWAITGFGGRLTSENWDIGAALQCEVPPWASKEVRDAYDNLKVDDYVRVIGAWGFDGVHTGRAEWIEVILALFRHQPNVKDGWFEIHPVTRIEVL